MGIFSSIIDGIFGTVGQGMANAANRRENARARKWNYTYGEMAAGNAARRQEEFYKKYMTPEAQLRQLMEAGLSPSLMYGEGGGGVGQTAPNAPMGTGANGFSPTPMKFDAPQIAMNAAQIDNLKADTEGKEIANADSPIGRYMEERNNAIERANDKEAERMNEIFTNMQTELTRAGYTEMSQSISISKGQSNAEGESHGWSLNITDSENKSHSFNIGVEGHASVGVTTGGGGSASFGKSNAHGESHGRGQSENNAKNWAHSVTEASGSSWSDTHNQQKAEEIIARAYEMMSNTRSLYDRNRENAENTYQERVKNYNENYNKYHRSQRRVMNLRGHK